MNIDQLLSRLTKVKGKNNAWTAACPAHSDRSPSLAVRATEDGRILLHCFGGCSVHEITSALGIDVSDLFPDSKESRKGVKPAFYATDLMRVISFESIIVTLCASAMAKGQQLNDEDKDRLLKAVERIQEAARHAGVMQ